MYTSAICGASSAGNRTPRRSSRCVPSATASAARASSMKRVRDRLAGVGLRWRLAAWVAAVTMACTAIAFVAVYRGTGTQLRGQIDNEITGDASGLARELSQADHHTPADVLEAANRY